jgi:prepilin-type N-terminal cleavage/methylation domain-containing protein
MRIERARRQSAGFSLIELLVVVAIILIGSAIALPMMLDYIRTARLRGGTSEVMAEIQRTRTEAVMKNVNLGVVFSIEHDATTNRPTWYRYFIEDGLITPADALAMGATANRGTRITRSNALSTPAVEQVQAGPLRRLPEGIEFSGACPGLAANASNMRFSRLGAVCRPGGSTACASFDSGTGGTNYIAFAGDGTASLCIADTRRGAANVVNISPAGRIRRQDAAVTP